MDYYLGEIRIFAGNFAPVDWAICNGAELTISGHEPLYSLIGTTYGGNGTTTFALPDFRGRLPIGFGAGTGLTARKLGETVGSETETLALTELPSHSHSFNVGIEDATTAELSSSISLAHPVDGTLCYVPNPPASGITLTAAQLNASSLGVAGGFDGQTQPHQNVMLSYPTNFIIAINGIYPQQD